MSQFSADLDNHDQQKADTLFRLYCAIRIFTDTRVIKKFLSSTVPETGEPLYSYLLRFRKEHCIVSSFFVEEKLGSNLYRIHDYFRRKDMILFSPTCAAGRKRGCIYFLGVLYKGDDCFYAFDPVLSFRGISPEDIEYLTLLIDPDRVGRGKITRIFELNPLPFLFLDTLGDPLPRIKDETIIEYCFTALPCTDTPPDNLPSPVTLRKKKGVYCYELPGDIEPETCRLYLDTVHKQKILLSRSRSGYREGALFFGDLFDFDMEPEWICSTPVAQYAGDILQKENLFHTLMDLFNDPIEDMPLPIRPPIRMPSSKQFSLPNYSRPKGDELNLFCGFFSDTHLFTLDNGKKTAELYKKSADQRMYVNFPDITDIDSAPALVEKIHKAISGTGLQTALLYSLYLLKHGGNEFLPISMYAGEYLKVPWQHVNSPDAPIENILTAYADYIYTIFTIFDLAEFDPVKPSSDDIDHASYNMKASEFFRSWIIWRDIF